ERLVQRYSLRHWTAPSARAVTAAGIAKAPRATHHPSAILSADTVLKQFDQIAGGVLQQDLRSAGAGDDIVAELHARGTQPRNLDGEIAHNQMNAIPAARPWRAAVGHRPSGRTLRPAEQQTERSEPHVGKRRGGVGADREAKMRGVPRNGGIDVVDHVPDVHGGCWHAGLTWV